MNRTSTQTACLLAVILQRSGNTRARVSAKTIRILSKRTQLRSAFIVELIAVLADRYDWILFELAVGGYGAVKASTLEAARPVTAKRLLTDDERQALRRKNASFDQFEEEVAPEHDQPEDE
ncbi:hypothetical protein [Hoeflea alexandrii]|uniref:hypothetical protein n=1 Tax=Hoeflea alexandrii TaxID=288436 RepID=UPI0022AFDED2|nr:hypothetical protein [Hoeflea alexandrii]MCZ4289712.1 hypothetical protein [Hoeflea alexandrii]